MKRKSRATLILLVSLFSFFIQIGIAHITERSQLQRLNKNTVTSGEFRDQMLNEDMLMYMEKANKSERSKAVGLYLLESKFSYAKFKMKDEKKDFTKLQKKWSTIPTYDTYMQFCDAIWKDVQYYPVPTSTSDRNITTSFSDSWMNERTYGGKRGHEGVDIMASKNERGLYPVISMTDGVVLSKGWLEKGGYRLLVKAPSGGCFYYAHLDSYADIKEGQEIRAGDVLGFMGDTGYGEKEGTRGKFPVHLHVGIYLYPDGKEESVNPYWVLRYLEKHKLKCAYS